jgi:lauroyl/myristoyl acyltransferase
MTDQVTEMLAEMAKRKIKPKSKEMEAYLQAGYPDMSVEKARTIMKERKENPASWPYEMLERAEAFLEAYESTSTVINSKRPGWRRTRNPY